MYLRLGSPWVVRAHSRSRTRTTKKRTRITVTSAPGRARARPAAGGRETGARDRDMSRIARPNPQPHLTHTLYACSNVGDSVWYATVPFLPGGRLLRPARYGCTQCTAVAYGENEVASRFSITIFRGVPPLASHLAPVSFPSAHPALLFVTRGRVVLGPLPELTDHHVARAAGELGDAMVLVR